MRKAARFKKLAGFEACRNEGNFGEGKQTEIVKICRGCEGSIKIAVVIESLMSQTHRKTAFMRIS